MDSNGCLSNVYDIDINHLVNVDAILFLFICWDVMSLINYVGKTREISQKSILYLAEHSYNLFIPTSKIGRKIPVLNSNSFDLLVLIMYYFEIIAVYIFSICIVAFNIYNKMFITL